MYRLLAIDIDGTLVNSRNELTSATLAALVRADAAGVRIVLATGRRYSQAIPLVEPLGLDLPLITASGALVKDPIDHRTLYQAQFQPRVLGDVLACIDRRGFSPVLCADTFAEGFDYYHEGVKDESRELTEYFEANPDRGRCWPDLVTRPPLDAFAGFVMGSREEMLGLEAIVHEEMPGQLQTNVLRSPRYRGFFMEFAEAGVTKWSAIQRLAATWGIGESAICAVGDDVNDIPMIQAAGLGVAMGNAIPEVKAAADRIAPGHDEDGLVRVVEWLLA
jgi:Cof subfamily protein (haloacid dehalogenase superfamily)